MIKHRYRHRIVAAWFFLLLLLAVCAVKTIAWAQNPTPTPRVPCPAQATQTARAQDKPCSFYLWDFSRRFWVHCSNWYQVAQVGTPTPTPTRTSTPTRTLTPTATPYSYGIIILPADRGQGIWWEVAWEHYNCVLNNGMHNVFVTVLNEYGARIRDRQVCLGWLEGNKQRQVCGYPDKPADSWYGMDFPLWGAVYSVWVADACPSDSVAGIHPRHPDEGPVTGWGYRGCTVGHHSFVITFRLRRAGLTATPTSTHPPPPTGMPTSSPTALPSPTATKTPEATASPQPTLSPEELDKLAERMDEVFSWVMEHPELYRPVMAFFDLLSFFVPAGE